MAGAVCASGLCNALTATCAGSTGSACTGLSQCSDDICGANGLCGTPTGAGPCSAGTAVAVCQSATCGANSGLCIPADSGGCGSDNDCGASQFCGAQALHCTADLPSGAALPSDGVHGACANGLSAACVSGLCNSASKTCGNANGGACTAASGCTAGVCGSNGLCGLADGQSPCSATTALCQSGVCSASGVCGSAGCLVDGDCPATAYCNANANLCKAKLAAGQALPQDGAHSGLCTTAAAQAVCTTGACNSASNTCALPSSSSCATDGQCATGTCGGTGRCGLADGEAGCTLATATLCQSGICSALGDRCVPLGAGRCAVDADCAAASYCDGTLLTCTPRLMAGTAIPTDNLHAGGCLPGNAQAVCASGLCNALTNTCADAAGAACTEAPQCTGNVCGSNGKCGAPDGEGPCLATQQADACQSGVCNAAAGLCQPAGDNRCVRDADCGAGMYCAQGGFTCAPQLTAGTPLPIDGIHAGACTMSAAQAVCASGLCNTGSNTCAASNGSSCQQPSECASNVCSAAGVCGLADGQPCTVAASCRGGQCTAGICGVGTTSTGSGAAMGAGAAGGAGGNAGSAGLGGRGTGASPANNGGGCNCSLDEGRGRGAPGSLASASLFLGLALARRRRR